jgi:hypothetical protein
VRSSYNIEPTSQTISELTDKLYTVYRGGQFCKKDTHLQGSPIPSEIIVASMRTTRRRQVGVTSSTNRGVNGLPVEVHRSPLHRQVATGLLSSPPTPKSYSRLQLNFKECFCQYSETGHLFRSAQSSTSIFDPKERVMML